MIPSPSSSSSAAPPSPSSSTSPVPSPSSSNSAAPPSPSSSSSAAPPSPSSSSSPLPSASSSSSAAPPSPSSSSSAAPPSPSSSSSAAPPSPSSSSSAAPPSPSSSSSAAPPSPSSSSSAAPPSPSSSSSAAPPSPSSSSSAAPPSPSSSSSAAPPSPSSSSSAAPPSPTPSTSPAAATTDSVLIDVGSASDPAVSGTTKYSSTSSFTGTSSIAANVYKTGRSGSDFSYSFDLQPGAYDIILGFAEYTSGFCSEPGKRVFNVYVNGEIQVESLDIYDEYGCFKGVEKKLGSSVGSVITEPLTIRLEAIVGAAIVSYVSISPAENGCIPASNSGGLADGEDHAAHSVPGSYPPQINANSPKSYVDSDGDGFVSVTIDGSGSHSHFFDNANNIIGQITEYTWTLVETGEVLSKQVSFSYNFPLGTTRLKLAVVDNSCTTDEAETTVTVTGSIQPGVYCYYYNGNPMIMGGDPLGNPQFAAVAANPNLGFPTFSFSGSTFLSRCFFFFEVDADSEAAAVSLSASGGTARVYKGEDLLLDTDGMASTTTELAVGLLAFEIIFERTSTSGTPAMQFKVEGSVPSSSKVFYDQSVVKPILQLLTPADGPDSGGTSVKVTGYGLFQPLTVTFGGQTVTAGGSTTPEQFFVTSPPAGSDSVVQVVATTAGGLSSNAVEFSYGSVCDSIGFDGVDMKTTGGAQVDFLQLPTCVTIGGDGKLYIGTLGATVQVLGYKPDTLTVDSHCYSKALLDNNFQKNSVPAQRDILGITFDPRDTGLKPYISTQTLFWFDKDRVDRSNTAAWRNGAIDRLKPGSDPSDSKVCLVYDKRVVSGLPISNHDHGVNQIVFTQGGDLLITVGGFTNSGLPQYRLGNYWETTLSAAILIAKLSKGGSFDGNIVYSNDDEPRLSKQIGGDVDVYCTGLRNPFAMAMTGSGDVYAVDQGPNCNFGNTATTCDDYDEEAALTYNRFKPTTWPGMVQHGCAKFPYSISRPDKVVHITQGSFYGHANLQRGGDECAWIDPFDDKTADDKAPPARYKKELATLKSSVTGIREYRSNHFCGALRGELIMSTHKGGTTYRMGVNGGSKTSGPDALASNGGTSFIEDAHGSLIFPMLNQAKVYVLKPQVGAKSGVYAANAVPWRHGKGGGTKVVIGGKNFGSNPSVSIGGSTCSVTANSETEITCTVPSSSSGLKDLVVTSSTGGSSTLPKAILYMN
ncbi:Bile salt-activated lipase [Gracilariopsis chorda]|uniref:Bile salt-activated lipase n=1 Tax=Gracilariopsis chorda TaxID=448386 RepID=A0A2V3IKP2_9FLOR|nr:Bile salt-activated lipase [Gracilariopsis chorda]|eukprot:PXF41700.1 Bile salt-activated lipase [Gracilariopsis chorda]